MEITLEEEEEQVDDEEEGEEQEEQEPVKRQIQTRRMSLVVSDCLMLYVELM